MRFVDLVNTISDKVSKAFLEENKNPTDELAKYASENSLSRMQVDRVVNKTNRKIIVGLQKEATKKDPHFTFPIVKTAEVMSVILPSKAILHQESVKSKIDNVMDRVFPQKSHVMQSTILDTPEKALSDFRNGSQITSSKNTVLQALCILKEKVRDAQSRYRSVENSIENAMMQLEKVAAQAYITQPVQVIESIRSEFVKSARINSVFDFIEDSLSGHRFQSIDEEFDIIKDNELSKIARSINRLEEEMRRSGLEVDTLESEYRRLRDISRSMK